MPKGGSDVAWFRRRHMCEANARNMQLFVLSTAQKQVVTPFRYTTSTTSLGTAMLQNGRADASRCEQSPEVVTTMWTDNIAMPQLRAEQKLQT